MKGGEEEGVQVRIIVDGDAGEGWEEGGTRGRAARTMG